MSDITWLTGWEDRHVVEGHGEAGKLVRRLPQLSRESCRQAWTWMIAWRGRGSNRSTQDLGWNRYGVWRGKEVKDDGLWPDWQEAWSCCDLRWERLGRSRRGGGRWVHFWIHQGWDGSQMCKWRYHVGSWKCKLRVQDRDINLGELSIEVVLEARWNHREC